MQIILKNWWQRKKNDDMFMDYLYDVCFIGYFKMFSTTWDITVLCNNMLTKRGPVIHTVVAAMTTIGIAKRRIDEIIQKAWLSRSASRIERFEPRPMILAPSWGSVLEDSLVPLFALNGGKEDAREVASTTVCTAKVADPSREAACRQRNKVFMSLQIESL